MASVAFLCVLCCFLNGDNGWRSKSWLISEMNLMSRVDSVLSWSARMDAYLLSEKFEEIVASMVILTEVVTVGRSRNLAGAYVAFA